MINFKYILQNPIIYAHIFHLYFELDNFKIPTVYVDLYHTHVASS